MSDTRTLLNRISALRQRLENGGSPDAPAKRLPALAATLSMGARQDALFDSSLRQLTDTPEGGPLPTQLTARARRLLDRSKDLVAQLRKLASAIETQPCLAQAAVPATEGAPHPCEDGGPLAVLFRETAAMA